MAVAGCTRKGHKVVAQVGEYVIHERDLADQRDINRVMGAVDDKVDPQKQLIDYFTQASILKSHGFNLGPVALEDEAKRIDDHTQDAEGLKQIKAVFKERREDYLRVFILPTLVRRSIYFEFFVKNRDLHQDTHKKAGDFLQKVLVEGVNFADQAKAMGASIVSLDLKGEVEPMEWQTQLYSALKPGQVSDHTIDLNEAVGVLRRPPEGKDRLEAVFFSKRNYDQWMKEERAKIPVKMGDQ